DADNEPVRVRRRMDKNQAPFLMQRLRISGIMEMMPQISLRAEEIFRIGAFPVTNAVLLSSIVLVLLAVLGWILRRKLAFVPGGIQNVFEIFIEGALGLMDSVLGDRRTSEKYMPLVFTIFLFVLVSNWMGLLPGVSSIIVHKGE